MESSNKYYNNSSYTLASRNSDDRFMFFSLEKIGEAKHHDGTVADVMLSRILQYRDGNAIMPDLADYVGFEIQHGEELTTEQIDKIILSYLEEKMKSDEIGFYVGRLVEQGNNDYQMIPSETVEKYVIGQIAEKRIKEQEKYIEHEKEKERELFYKELDARKHIEEQEKYFNEQKEKRLENPNIKLQGRYRIDEKIYEDYNGINIAEGENQGEILRIRKLDKVGKDGSGTYLYSAFLSNTPNEHDVEMLSHNNPSGVPVCFELEKRFEDIVKDGDIQEIIALLAFLSDSKNFENPKQLSYIGKIDKNFQITKDMESDSFAIRNKIKEMQKAYEEEQVRRNIEESYIEED